MGKISRDRGSSYEREVANAFKDWGYDAYRTAQHMGKTGKAPDVAIPGLHAECKRRRQIAAHEWMKQAVNDSTAEGKGNIPTVFCRADNEKTIVILRLEDFLQMYREWRSADELQKVRGVSDTAAETAETKETTGNTELPGINRD